MRTIGCSEVSSRVCALPWYQRRAPQQGAYHTASTPVSTRATVTGVQLKFMVDTGYSVGNTNATCAQVLQVRLTVV